MRYGPYEQPMQKTVMMMALTVVDTVHSQVGPHLSAHAEEKGLSAFTRKLDYRNRHIEKWLSSAWEFVRNLDGARPIAAPAMKSIDGFLNAFTIETTNIATQNPDLTDFQLATIFEEGANVLLYDVHAYCLLTHKQKCWRWLRHHHAALTESAFRIMDAEAKERCEVLATDLYLSTCDLLKPENHRLAHGIKR